MYLIQLVSILLIIFTSMLTRKIDLYLSFLVMSQSLTSGQYKLQNNDLGGVLPGCSLWKVWRGVLIRFSLQVSWYSALSLPKSGLFLERVFLITASISLLITDLFKLFLFSRFNFDRPNAFGNVSFF